MQALQILERLPFEWINVQIKYDPFVLEISSENELIIIAENILAPDIVTTHVLIMGQ